ncbi:MAG: hypothetical protein ACI88H_002085 [Cocleimonas sp.]|jgi:hypothetical protein
MEKLIERARASMNLILLITVFSTISVLNDERSTLSLLMELCNGINSSNEILKDPRLKSTSLAKCIENNAILKNSSDKILSIKISDLKYVSCKDENELCVPLNNKQEIQRLQPELLSEKYIDDPIVATLDQDIYLRLFGGKKGIADKILERADELNISRSKTILSIDEKERGQLKIPIINMSTDIFHAVNLFIFTLIWPYFYLLSVVRTIACEISFLNERSGMDWIFFHADNMSVLFGLLWLMSPLIVLIVLSLNYSVTLPIAFAVGAVITFLSIFITIQIYNTKRALYSRFDKLGG